MGWSGGTDIACGVIKLAKGVVPEDAKPKFYKGLIALLEGGDWDCQYEALRIDPAFDKVMKKHLKDQGFG